MNESSPAAIIKPQPNWFRRHDKFLTTLGTLIVLLTFAAKEQLRDVWRDRAQVIEKGRYAIDLDEQLYLLKFQLAEIGQNIELDQEVAEENAKMAESVKADAKAKKKSALQLQNDLLLPKANKAGCVSVNSYGIVRSEAEPAEYYDDRSRAILEAVSPLVEVYGEDSTWATELRANSKDLVDRAQDLRGKAEKIRNDFFSSNCLDPEQFRMEISGLYLPASADAGQKFEANKAFLARVVQQAYQDHKDFECKAKVADVVAICLYVLGVLLSFAGKFFGGRDLLPEVE